MPHVVKTIQTHSLSQEELAEMERKNPSGYLKMMMSIRSSSTEKCSSSSTISSEESFVEPMDEVFRQLKLKLLGRYLFQTLNEDFMFSYGIKALLKKLNTPSALKVVVGFVVEFGSLLDQITDDIQRKNESMVNLKPKEYI